MERNEIKRGSINNATNQRHKSLLLHVLATGLCLSLQQAGVAEQPCPNVSHGTLIVWIPTSSGLLIAADKRSIHQVGGQGERVDDTTEKLNPLGPCTVVATTGWTEWWDPQRTEEMRLNATSVVSVYLLNLIEIGSIHDHKEAISTLLTQCFEKFLKTKNIKVPNAKRGANESLFVTTIFNYNKRSKNFERLSIALKCLGDSGQQLTPFVNDKAPEGNFDLAKATCIGATSVLHKLMTGTGPQFEELRRRKHIQQFLLHPQETEAVSGEAAAVAAANLIKDTNKFFGYVNNGIPTVGTTMDVILLGKDRLQYIRNRKCDDVIAMTGTIFDTAQLGPRR